MYTKKEKKNKLVYIGAVTKVTALLLKNYNQKQPDNNIFGIIGGGRYER